MGFGFLAALGWLALIGIPVLIIIYIIKPKYQERKISSTYIWKLSLKYRKRKIPLQWLKSLLLIVQCIIVAVLAMLLAKPYVSNASNGYNYKKIVLIDASASMMTESEGKSRFKRAQDKACEIAETAAVGQDMTVIMVADVPVVIAREQTSPSAVQLAIRSQECKGTNADYASAITTALEVAGETVAGFTLITDHFFAENGFFEVINVSNSESNIAVDDAWEDLESDESSKDYLEMVFYANYFSYNKQAKITPCARIEYVKNAMTATGTDSDYRVLDIKMSPVELVAAYDDEGNVRENVYGATIKFDYQTLKKAAGGRFTSYKSAEFYFLDENGNEVKDAFTDDDRYIVMSDASSEKFSVLLAGDDVYNSLFYLNTMMSSIEACYTERVIPNQVAASMPEKNKNYDMYIYDGYYPTRAGIKEPNDGAIWLINPPAGDYSSLGFTVGGAVSHSGNAKINRTGAGHEVMTNIAEVSSPMNNLNGVFAYTKYTQATIVDKSIQVLVSAEDGSPLIFTGETLDRVKFVVFAFDVVYTDYPLVFQNFPIMAQNIVAYMTDYTILNGAGRPAYGDYVIGETITVNVKPNAQSLSIIVGDDEKPTATYQSNEFGKPITHTLERGGIYQIQQTIVDVNGATSTVTDKLFVRCDSEESNFAVQGGRLTGEEQPVGIATDDTVKKDVIYKWFAAALVALLLIEWGLQYREQY